MSADELTDVGHVGIGNFDVGPNHRKSLLICACPIVLKQSPLLCHGTIMRGADLAVTSTCWWWRSRKCIVSAIRVNAESILASFRTMNDGSRVYDIIDDLASFRLCAERYEAGCSLRHVGCVVISWFAVLPVLNLSKIAKSNGSIRVFEVKPVHGECKRIVGTCRKLAAGM